MASLLVFSNVLRQKELACFYPSNRKIAFKPISSTGFALKVIGKYD
jgi:hypothetical protein